MSLRAHVATICILLLIAPYTTPVVADPVGDTVDRTVGLANRAAGDADEVADAAVNGTGPVDEAADDATGVAGDLADDPPDASSDPSTLVEEAERAGVRIYNAVVTFAARLRNDAVIWVAKIRNDVIEGLARARNDLVENLANLRNEVVIAGARLRNEAILFTAGAKNEAIVTATRAKNDVIRTGAKGRNGVVRSADGVSDAAVGAGTSLGGGVRGWAGTTAGEGADLTHPALNLVLDAARGEQVTAAEAVDAMQPEFDPFAPRTTRSSAGVVHPFKVPLPRDIDDCANAEEFYSVGIRWIEDGEPDRRQTCLPYDPGEGGIGGDVERRVRDQPYRVKLCDEDESCGSMIVRLSFDRGARQARLGVQDLSNDEKVYGIRVEAGNSALEYHFYDSSGPSSHPEQVNATLADVWIDSDEEFPYNLFGNPVKVSEEMKLTWTTHGEDRDTTRFYIDKDTDSRWTWHGAEVGTLYSISADEDDREGFNPGTFEADILVRSDASGGRARIDGLVGVEGAAIAVHNVLEEPIVVNPIQDTSSVDVRYEDDSNGFWLNAKLHPGHGNRFQYGRVSWDDHEAAIRNMPRVDPLVIRGGDRCRLEWCIHAPVDQAGARLDLLDVMAGIRHIPEGTIDVAFGEGLIDGSVEGNDETLGGVDAYAVDAFGFDHLWVGGLDELTVVPDESFADARIDASFTRTSAEWGVPYVVVEVTDGADHFDFFTWGVRMLDKPAGNRLEVDWYSDASGLVFRGQTFASIPKDGTKNFIRDFRFNAWGLTHLKIGSLDDGPAPFGLTKVQSGGESAVGMEATFRHHRDGLDCPDSSDITVSGRLKREGGQVYEAHGELDGDTGCDWDASETLDPGQSWTFEAFDVEPLIHFDTW